MILVSKSSMGLCPQSCFTGKCLDSMNEMLGFSMIYCPGFVFVDDSSLYSSSLVFI